MKIKMAFLVLLALLPLRVEAHGRHKILIQIGKPSAWPLEQALYQHAKMGWTFLEPGGLSTDKTAGGNGRMNASRIAILKSLLDIEALYEQKMGIQNRAQIREEILNQHRSDDARIELAQIRSELEKLNISLKEMEREESRLQAGDEWEKINPPGKAQSNQKSEMPSAEKDRKRREAMANLQTGRVALSKEKDALEAKINELEKGIRESIQTPDLKGNVMPTSPSLIKDPQKDELRALGEAIKKAIKEERNPSLAPSVALDNFIQMQYEIISKQLTLLRDELNPEEKLIFLEFPLSIDRVPGNANRYRAKLQWSISVSDDHPVSRDKIPDPSTPGYRKPGLRTSDKGNDPITNYDNTKLPSQDVSQVSPKHGQDMQNDIRVLTLTPGYSLMNNRNFKADQVIKKSGREETIRNGHFRREANRKVPRQGVSTMSFCNGSHKFGWILKGISERNPLTPFAGTFGGAFIVPISASILELRARVVLYDGRGFSAGRSGSKRIVSKRRFYIRIPGEYR